MTPVGCARRRSSSSSSERRQPRASPGADERPRRARTVGKTTWSSPRLRASATTRAPAAAVSSVSADRGRARARAARRRRTAREYCPPVRSRMIELVRPRSSPPRPTARRGRTPRRGCRVRTAEPVDRARALVVREPVSRGLDRLLDVAEVEEDASRVDVGTSDLGRVVVAGEHERLVEVLARTSRSRPRSPSPLLGDQSRGAGARRSTGLRERDARSASRIDSSGLPASISYRAAWARTSACSRSGSPATSSSAARHPVRCRGPSPCRQWSTERSIAATAASADRALGHEPVEGAPELLVAAFSVKRSALPSARSARASRPSGIHSAAPEARGRPPGTPRSRTHACPPRGAPPPPWARGRADVDARAPRELDRLEVVVREQLGAVLAPVLGQRLDPARDTDVPVDALGPRKLPVHGVAHERVDESVLGRAEHRRPPLAAEELLAPERAEQPVDRLARPAPTPRAARPTRRRRPSPPRRGATPSRRAAGDRPAP